tara:strand:+ start:1448 stop:3679 length:2232 start_codon:yes stop_codon:yes gene_type:complete
MLAQLIQLKADGDYAEAYELIYLQASIFDAEGKASPAPYVDPASWVWFWGAKEINAGEGPFSDFIRSYTSAQYHIRFGATLSPVDLQDVSNAIAEAVISDVINRNDLPPINDLADLDASQTAAQFFQGEEAVWSGNLLFILLGYSQPYFQTILEDSSDVYDLFALLESTLTATGTVLPQALDVLSDALKSVIAAGGGAVGAFETLIDSIAVNLLNQNFLTSAYGPDATAAISIDAADSFGLLATLQRLELGTINHDNLSGTSGADIMLGGVSDDTLFWSSGADLLDGGQGYDTADYSADPNARNFTFSDETWAAGFSAKVTNQGLGGGLLPDYLFSIESIVGTSGNDIFKFTSTSTSFDQIALDGGGGSDTLDFSSLSDGITVDVSFNEMAIQGQDSGRITFQNMEKFVGTQFVDNITTDIPWLQIFAGAGEDKIRASGIGTIIYSGGGEDSIEVAGLATLFADASAEDKIGYVTKLLTGALGWGGTSDKGAVVNLSQGVRYELNIDGELIVEGLGGQKLFIANYIGGPGAAFQTAGIYVGNQEWHSYLLMNAPEDEVAKNNSGMKEILNAIYATTLGQGVLTADPLVLDLDGDGLELAALSSASPLFDIDSDGFAEKTGWTYGGDGFLALDANADGIINDGSELFGDASQTGFEELALHDLNLDGVIDASDAVFGSLRVWRDANGDAVTDAGELLTLTELGITAINLPTVASDPVMNAGNVVGDVSTFELVGGVMATNERDT